MKTDTFFTMSKADELLLEVLAAEPDPGIPVKGIIQIVHGNCEHKERYLPFIRYMTSAGYACIIHDHRGHGRSVRSQEDLGYMYGLGEKGLLSDIHQITVMAKKRWPGLPLIQLGHGMGSLAVRCCLKKWEEDVFCVILSGSHSKNPLTAPGIIYAKLRRRKVKKKSKVLKQIMHVPYDKRFPGENAEFNWLCRNQDVVAEYNEDPLCGFELSVDGYDTYLHLMQDTYKKQRWRTEKPELPILFVGGADDPYIGGPAPFHQALRAMRSLGYRNVKGKLYPGLRHEVLNEEERELVFRDLENYLDKMLEKLGNPENE
ncbi:MAG: alpha/beta hydrolase [Lachnospiraceae bacterium]|nr:alpha/beta hydrolase [Lachnospiraceae bacterium]